MNKVFMWVSVTLIFSICLAFCAGAALLDVFVVEHNSNEDIIVESVDFGNKSENNSLKNETEETKSTSKHTTSNKNNKETSKVTESSNSSNSSNVENEPFKGVLTDKEMESLSKSITTSKTVGTYSNDNVELSVIEKIFKSGIRSTTYFVVDIKVSSVEYLKTALASGNKLTTNKTEKVATLATAKNAILAINGDGCGQSNRSSGYVVRDGVTYRSTARSSGDTQSLVIYGDGSMGIIDEKKTSLASVNNKWQVFSFGPSLINNGAISVTEGQEISGQSMADNPRTSIGMVEPLHYVIIVGNGRTSSSKGLTLYQLAQALAYEGCTVGYNLDGGGSSTLWFNGKVINYPTTNGKYGERAVSDIVYIGA
jgi:exopolysaccharide biosynthesis protein